MIEGKHTQLATSTELEKRNCHRSRNKWFDSTVCAKKEIKNKKQIIKQI